MNDQRFGIAVVLLSIAVIVIMVMIVSSLFSVLERNDLKCQALHGVDYRYTLPNNGCINRYEDIKSL